ncbi:hypothetical protein APR04_002717 [Promicromonospora umidemergens]|uniref:Uncharacterized protein n=1 Tax=Promicromonospora umidemergens TaxID=629679 RepID=A0ABP8WHE8_9MICO|nr:hypothetical protein [Promicromonospora umidemergens]MCP2283804.1 hypothetical protein [Promicromonospora umidemergens]
MSDPDEVTMTSSAVQHLPRFFVKQHFTVLVNRYTIVEALDDGSEGRMLAFAQQKRLAVREKVTFYEDEARTRPLFGFRARQLIDVAAAYDVTTADGSAIGSFEKDFAASLIRSSFHLRAPALEAYGQERSTLVAILRRVAELPLPVHFTFRDTGTGAPVLTSERQLSLRDRYTVEVPDARVDFRLAASVAVGVDALLGR